jgi:hypothetical protein
MAANTIAFPEAEELPLRLKDSNRRARSLSAARPTRVSPRKKHSIALIIREKNQAVSTRLPLRPLSHAGGVTKNRRTDSSLMPVIAEGADPGLKVVRPRKSRIAARPTRDHTSALESLTLNMTVAQRVAWRRRQPATVFISHKTRAATKTATKATRAVVRRRTAPVFGAASLAPVDLDEVALSAALTLHKPQTNL